MLFQLFFLVGLFLILYRISDRYARRYLAWNPADHTPVYTPGSSSASTVVCVLGWGGCTRRQLRRLLEFYASHDIPTISWINPMLNYLTGCDRKQVELVLDFLLHENRMPKTIIIHLHSNNGSLAWGYMLETMKTNERYRQVLENIHGIILDSAPFTHAQNTPDWLIASAIGTSRACVSIILNRAQYFHWLWSPLITYYLLIQFFYRQYFSSDPSSSSDKVRDFLHATPADIKQFYLYGDADRLIPPHIIEQFMIGQVKRGVQVTSHRFVDSGHINHFRVHPIEYQRLILNFLKSNESELL